LLVAFNLRKDKKVKHFRDFLIAYQNAIYENDKEKIEKYDKQLKEALLGLKEEYKGSIIFRRIRVIPLLITLFGIYIQNVPLIISGSLSSVESYFDFLIKYFKRRNLIFLYHLKEREQVLANLNNEIERVFRVRFQW
jgi:hypothetical protein